MEKNELSNTSAETQSKPADIEHGLPVSPIQSTEKSHPQLSTRSRLRKWNTRIESFSGFEQGDLTRITSDQRHAPSFVGYVQMLLLWLSANVSINNLAVGLLGPLLFELGFLDSSLCAVFGAALGAVSTAYMSIWGPQSGCRTMVNIIFPIPQCAGSTWYCVTIHGLTYLYFRWLVATSWVTILPKLRPCSTLS